MPVLRQRRVSERHSVVNQEGVRRDIDKLAHVVLADLLGRLVDEAVVRAVRRIGLGALTGEVGELGRVIVGNGLPRIERSGCVGRLLLLLLLFWAVGVVVV